MKLNKIPTGHTARTDFPDTISPSLPEGFS